MLLETLGIIGTILVALAYIPQIVHLIKQHCAYGMSFKAWLIWFIAASLILPHALSTGDTVFIVLQLVNMAAILFIMAFTYFHQGKICHKHKVL